MKRGKGRILIVDDDEFILLTGKMFLEQHFPNVSTINDPKAIQAQLQEVEYDVILLDMNFREGETTGREGMSILRFIRENYRNTCVILMTAYGGIDIAVDAIKEGAFDFVVKPWQNDKLLTTVSSAVSLSNEKHLVTRLKGQQQIMSSDMAYRYEELIGKSPEMLEVLKIIRKVADTPAEILVLGENGTGKELVAREIHRRSSRSDQVFISVDLGALTESLFESELFGHKKGAFTDAKANRVGRFEAADGGTLFLDEIGNLSPALQAKLLTVIQNKRVVPLGANVAIEVDVRIICATNKDLSKMVRDGSFREDLLYRINTVAIPLPPLRARIEDIPLLAHHFLKKISAKYGKADIRLSDHAIKEIQQHSWPGNIRELQHTIERAVIMSEDEEINKEDLGLTSALDNGVHFDNLDLELLEKWAIETALRKHKGNISHASEELGLSRGAMYRRMEKYDI